MRYTSLLSFLLILSFIPSSYAQDALTSAEKASVEEFDVINWKIAFARMKKLSQIGFHPFLMPLIMRNSDFIELTDEQIKVFKEWRSENRVPLLHAMDKIIAERSLFHKLSLSPNTAEEVLITKQQEIFKLHKKVLKYQLSCRRNILDTFTEEQWDNFNFVLAENGYEVD
ncbi:MAG: hypothetical protein KAU21_04220 [Gammaproteobacteria bacterium]|nr:hypothetical protein [Gammaproteobacteria bacterium]